MHYSWQLLDPEAGGPHTGIVTSSPRQRYRSVEEAARAARKHAGRHFLGCDLEEIEVTVWRQPDDVCVYYNLVLPITGVTSAIDIDDEKYNEALEEIARLARERKPVNTYYWRLRNTLTGDYEKSIEEYRSLEGAIRSAKNFVIKHWPDEDPEDIELTVWKDPADVCVHYDLFTPTIKDLDMKGLGRLGKDRLIDLVDRIKEG